MTDQEQRALKHDHPMIALKRAVLDFCELKTPDTEQMHAAKHAIILLAEFTKRNGATS